MKTRFINQAQIAVGKDGMTMLILREVELDQLNQPQPPLGEEHGRFVMSVATAAMIAENINKTIQQLQTMDKADMSTKN